MTKPICINNFFIIIIISIILGHYFWNNFQKLNCYHCFCNAACKFILSQELFTKVVNECGLFTGPCTAVVVTQRMHLQYRCFRQMIGKDVKSLTYLPKMSLNLGSSSMWYFSIYSKSSSVPRTLEILTNCKWYNKGMINTGLQVTIIIVIAVIITFTLVWICLTPRILVKLWFNKLGQVHASSFLSDGQNYSRMKGNLNDQVVMCLYCRLTSYMQCSCRKYCW